MGFVVKVVAIVQARMSSTRLPGKVMKEVCNTPILEILLKRLSFSKKIDQVIVATSDDPKNLVLKKHLTTIGFECVTGSEEDVLSRVFLAASEAKSDIVVRITGDCPFVDAAMVDNIITIFQDQGVDYCSNVSPATFPDGLDVEVFSFSTLNDAYNNATSLYDKEHVTPFIRNNRDYKKFNITNDIDLSHLRWTLDEQEDFNVIKNIFEYFQPNLYFTWKDVLNLYNTKPELFNENMNISRNEGAAMGKGQKLWKRAKKIIPGGNMLLSKRSEMFLPDQWPSYFSKSKGCTVWDMDGVSYTDMSIMGIGTNILGYGHPEVDEAVQQAVIDGNMSTLNAPEEVYLAEKLISLHPWADMARFARSGGEANAIAIRIARAASGRDNVAICGYHGWHDWYLAANLGGEEKLQGHLLPGLDTKGVPDSLSGTVFPFVYNDFSTLEELVSNHDIGTIKMEVVRNMGPEDNFLERVRELATNKNIVLIFDECTSGFRETLGGLHKKYKVEPDIAMFGKAMGNGYAVTATIGRREVMEAAQSSFISSTFWTERIGSVAALKTIEVMEKEKSWELITSTGNKIRKGWQELADLNKLQINHFGLPALTGFNFDSTNALKYKTFISQEMLKKGYLASNCVYVCTEHSDEVIDSYFNKLSDVFQIIKKCEEGKSIDNLLNGPVCHDGFKRLN
jgi:glutamate-1-semialdehyde 2,1-aminomutase